MARASPSLVIWGFCPSSLTTRQANGGGTLPSTSASMVQYSSGTNALDLRLALGHQPHRHRLHPARADRPRFTLAHSTGLIW